MSHPSPSAPRPGGDLAGAASVAVEDLHKSYGSLEVLKGISLTVAAGQVVCLIGPSGSGKSTLLRCVNLLEQVDDGQVFLGGEDITDPRVDANRVRARIGVVFQQFNLLPRRTAEENVAAPLLYARGRDYLRRRRTARELLDRVGLGERAVHVAHALAELHRGLALEAVRAVRQALQDRRAVGHHLAERLDLVDETRHQLRIQRFPPPL